MTNILEQKQHENWKCDEKLAVDKWRSIEWARSILKRKDVVYLDTETTGLEGAYLVEIAVLSHHGSIIFESLVKPPVPITPKAQQIHGISEKMLENAPTFAEIYPRLQEVLRGRHVVIYNAKFDIGIIENCCDYYDLRYLKGLRPNSSCAMLQYASYCGKWNDYWQNYTWQKLPGAGHKANADARACYELIRYMAEDNPYCPVEIIKMFPPIQLFCKWKKILRICLEWDLEKTDYYRPNYGFFLSLPKFYIKTSQQTKEGIQIKELPLVFPTVSPDPDVDEIPF